MSNFFSQENLIHMHTRDIITQELPPCPLDKMNYYFFSICPHIKIDLTMLQLQFEHVYYCYTASKYLITYDFF